MFLIEAIAVACTVGVRVFGAAHKNSASHAENSILEARIPKIKKEEASEASQTEWPEDHERSWNYSLSSKETKWLQNKY